MIDWNESPTVTRGGGFAASITFAMQRATNSGFGAAFMFRSTTRQVCSTRDV